jgi:hypothetical protein
MTIIPNFNHEYVFSNLDTYQYTIQSTNLHTVSVKMNDKVLLNNLSVIIKQNGTTKATSSVTAGNPNELNLSVLLNCASGDTIQVVVSSSDPLDSAPNRIKGFININQTV